MKQIAIRRVKSFEIAIFLIFSTLYAVLNSKNLLGSHSLFMDEKLIFDGVLRILQPTDFHSLFIAITDGGDQRYGRLLWNLIALFSFFPHKIWGVQGVIFTERMFGGVVIILAIMILARIYRRNVFSYSLIVTAIILLPFTTYYATTPKPEPLILFFLSLYLLKSKTLKNMLGKQWIFLGIIVGLKISSVFILFAIILVISMQTFVNKEKLKTNDLQLSLAYFSIGFSIAVPTLYVFAIFGIGLIVITKLTLTRMQLILARVTASMIAFTVLVISEQSFRNYFTWIIGNSRHGSDSELINYKSWLGYIFEVYFQSQISALVVLILTVIVAFNKVRIHGANRNLELLLPFFLGLVTTIPIILFVERIWGFYLWCGSIFLVITIHNLVKYANLNPKEYFALFLICAGTLTVERVNPIQFFETEVRNVLTIQSSANFRLQNLRYTKIVNVLDSESSSSGKVLTVAFDPILWIPNSTERYEIRPFWGPYTGWETPIDILVFSNLHTPASATSQDRNLQTRRSEIFKYKRYVASQGSECGQKHCYTVAHQFDGIVILKLQA